MFAALVKTAVEEIAWEGPPGISWSQLLATLQQNGDFTIDAPIRTGLWRELAKQDIIVRGAKGAAHRSGRALPAATAAMAATEPSDADSGKVLLDIPNALRSHFLLLDAHPDIAENDLSRRALQLVAKSRAKGTSGASLASQLGVNCRDLFYVLEGLRTAGLLVGVLPLAQKDLGVSKESSDLLPGNLFLFSRFFDTENVEKDQIQAFIQSSSSRLQNQILSALQLHSSGVCFEHDLKCVIGQSLEENTFKPCLSRRTVNKIYQRIRNDMVAAGDVECVRAWDHHAHHWRDALCIPGTHGGQTENPGMQPLLAITEGQDDSMDANSAQHSDQGSQVNHIPSIPDLVSAPRRTLRVCERSFTQQAEDLIRCSSKCCNGITGPELADYLGIRRKHSERILNDLVKRQRVLRVFESDGKTHLNRYFDAQHRFDAPSGTSHKRPRNGTQPEKPSKHGKEAGNKRIDTTFVRRQQHLEVLLQARGVLTPVDVTKIAAEDAALGKMDRKTAKKLFIELSESNKNVGIATRNATDDPDRIQFAYWKPLHSRESARKAFEEALKVQEERRFKKLRKDAPLALTDAADSQEQVLSPQRSTPAARRTLPASVTAQNLHRLGRIHMLTTPQVTLDQRILQHYGFLSAIVVRTQLLHEMLLRKAGHDFELQWTPSKIVDEMDLDIFLQVIGCGTYSDLLDEILLSQDSLLVRDVPDELRRMLLGRTHTSGNLRSVHAVRRLMRHLVKLGLAESLGEDEPGAVQIKYQLNRFVQVPTFTAESKVTDPAGSFDLAQPTAANAYWTCLQGQVEIWRTTVRADSSSGEDKVDKADKVDKTKDPNRRAKRTVTLPANAMLPEIFQSKNWTKSAWLTPRQRASMNDFYSDVHAKVEACNPDEQMEEVQINTPGRVLTPKSAEVMALSRQIMVPPDRIIKYCRHLTDLRGAHPSGNQVEFSSLLAVRFKCHLCGYLCFQRTSIAEHYAKLHGEKLPEDESRFSEADFYAQRLEQAKPRRDGKRRLRKRSVQTPDANPYPWPAAEGQRSDEEEEGQERSRWGAELADDASWLQLFAVAESMACLQQASEGKAVQKRPVGCELRTDASTWPILSRLSGRSASYCRSRLHGLLSQDVKNRRTVAALRSFEMQAESGLTSLGMKGSIGRAVAKSLLLTCHEVPAYWWKIGFLNADVKAMVDCVIRQWQCDGLVSKYKEARCTKLPPRARPSWILTWFSRNRMFGKPSDLPRWQDVMSLLFGSQSIAKKMLPESSDGAQLLVLSGAVANDSASLCPDWGDPEFYRQSLSSPPPWQMSSQMQSDEEECEVEEAPGTSSRAQYGGVQSHLQLTSEEPTLKSVLVDFNPRRLKAAALLHSLSLSQDELNKISGENEPINPQMQYCTSGQSGVTQGAEKEDEEDEGNEGNEEDPSNGEDEAPVARTDADSVQSGADVECKLSGKPAQVSTMCAAFAAYAEESCQTNQGTKVAVDDLLQSATFLFKTIVLSQSGEATDASSPDRDLLPGLALSELREKYESYEREKIPKAKDSRDTRARAASSGFSRIPFQSALRCLEDLRLLVPFPCGEDFRLVLARNAAPYCLKHVDEADKRPSEELLQLLHRFQQNGFGRHWLLPYVQMKLPQESIQEAAACIVFTALGADSMLERWLLPAGLVAPCAWVNAKGQLNMLVLRCLLSRLLQLLLRQPFASAAELIQHLGILDICEVEYLLELAVFVGAADPDSGIPETEGGRSPRYRCAFLR